MLKTEVLSCLDTLFMSPSPSKSIASSNTSVFYSPASANSTVNSTVNTTTATSAPHKSRLASSSDSELARTRQAYDARPKQKKLNIKLSTAEKPTASLAGRDDEGTSSFSDEEEDDETDS